MRLLTRKVSDLVTGKRSIGLDRQRHKQTNTNFIGIVKNNDESALYDYIINVKDQDLSDNNTILSEDSEAERPQYSYQQVAGFMTDETLEAAAILNRSDMFNAMVDFRALHSADATIGYSLGYAARNGNEDIINIIGALNNTYPADYRALDPSSGRLVEIKPLALQKLLEQEDNMGLTPLGQAIEGRRTNSVALILAMDANPLTPYNGTTPLEHATTRGSKAIVALINEAIAKQAQTHEQSTRQLASTAPTGSTNSWADRVTNNVSSALASTPDKTGERQR
jgi:hypothetical protein